MIDVRGLTRHFGTRTAVDQLTMQVRAGEVCALLGPNGAGKTTTVRMLMGLVRPTGGEATVAGVRIPGDPVQLAALRARVGLLTETPGFYDRLSATENLALFGQMYGMGKRQLLARIQEPLTTLQLWDRRDEMVATYSKGMKQKLAVVRAVFHDPDVIFFDEPTAGLDPESARVVRQMILSLKHAGRTMLVCTHNLTEASQLADVVAILRGNLLAFGPPDSLGSEDGLATCRITVGSDAVAARTAILTLPGVRSATSDGSTVTIQLDDARRRNPAIVAALVARNIPVVEVRVIERTLEDVYLHAIGGGGDSDA